jgi:branched-chain amino acid transport system ATP-binding protein
MSNLLEVKNGHTYYGESHVLHGVSLHVKQGDFVTLLGRNGMGKTTLLRSIMGLTPLREGEIVFNGKRIDGLKPHAVFDLGLGYVPQGRHMFPHLTVLENLRMGLKNKRQKHSPIFDKLYGYFPVLEERRGQAAGTLSGGEQQMLAIARALAGEVEILLLDEPTEGVQPSIVDQILEHLIVINREESLSILLVEQNMELALDVANSYFVMSKGVVVEGGLVSEMDREKIVEKYMVV